MTGRPREKRGYSKRRRRGSSIPEPGLDPRPSPPKSSTAARHRNSVLFSPLLCSFLLFSSLRVSPFFYLSPPPASLFRPFLPDHGDNRPTPFPHHLLFYFFFVFFFIRQCVPPAHLDGRELWEKRPARPVASVTGHGNEPFVRIRLGL